MFVKFRVESLVEKLNFTTCLKGKGISGIKTKQDIKTTNNWKKKGNNKMRIKRRTKLTCKLAQKKLGICPKAPCCATLTTIKTIKLS